MSDSADDLNDREKAAALEDFVRAFCEEYWDVDQSDTWVVIDGSAEVSPETVRVLRLMFNSARSQVDPEWGRSREQIQGPECTCPTDADVTPDMRTETGQHLAECTIGKTG